MLAYQCGDKLTPGRWGEDLRGARGVSKPGEYAYETEPRRMINTNHPLNGAMALVLAGQLMGKPERIALGPRPGAVFPGLASRRDAGRPA